MSYLFKSFQINTPKGVIHMYIIIHSIFYNIFPIMSIKTVDKFSSSHYNKLELHTKAVTKTVPFQWEIYSECGAVQAT